MAFKLLKRKIENMITRAVLKLINITDGKVIVQVSGLSDEVRSDIEHLQQYGFRSMPKEGARGVWIAHGGNKDNSLLIVIDDKRHGKEPEYVPGESRQYDDQGDFHRIFEKKHRLQGDDYEFRIDDDNKIEFVAGSLKFTVGGEIYTFTSSKLQTTTADVVAKTISLLNHDHPITGGSSAPGPTGPPTP